LYLILYSFWNPCVKEGMSSTNSYQPYSAGNIPALANKNAGNIQVLESKITTLEDLPPQVKENTASIKKMSEQIFKMSMAQKSAATQFAGTTPHNITGTGTGKK